MRFRVDASGGELSLTSVPDQGTCIVSAICADSQGNA